MDEVLVDFYNHPNDFFKFEKPYNRVDINQTMNYLPFWKGLLPLKGAVEAVQQLIKSDMYDIYIATKPVEGVSNCYAGKCNWINQHLPELAGKLIMTPNKNLLIGDYLIDDNDIYKHGFKGKFILFRRTLPSEVMWNIIVDTLTTGVVYA